MSVIMTIMKSESGYFMSIQEICNDAQLFRFINNYANCRTTLVPDYRKTNYESLNLTNYYVIMIIAINSSYQRLFGYCMG